jgi:hypothetical protein
MIVNKIINLLNNPITALILIILFAILFFTYNALTSNINNHFFAFGPTKDEDNKPVTFLGTYLDSWGHVIIAYILILLASIFSNYYVNVMDHNIFHSLHNFAITDMKSNKLLTYIITMIDPFIKTLLYIIEFYATATFQLQYIIPQFLGSYIMNLPFTLHLLNSKRFV